MARKPISFRLDDSQFEAVRRDAERRGLSVTGWLEEAVRTQLAGRIMLREAIADAAVSGLGASITEMRALLAEIDGEFSASGLPAEVLEARWERASRIHDSLGDAIENRTFLPRLNELMSHALSLRERDPKKLGAVLRRFREALDSYGTDIESGRFAALSEEEATLRQQQVDVLSAVVQTMLGRPDRGRSLLVELEPPVGTVAAEGLRVPKRGKGAQLPPDEVLEKLDWHLEGIDAALSVRTETAPAKPDTAQPDQVLEIPEHRPSGAEGKVEEELNLFQKLRRSAPKLRRKTPTQAS